MTYEEALGYLGRIGQSGTKLGLERMQALMAQLGHPEEKLRVIHVAGTNGKGSTCAMIAQVLQESGWRVGLYTSPHLIRYEERYQINRTPIEKEAFCALIQRVKEAGEALREKKGEEPTVFEVTTAAAFYYFAQQNVDFLVLEVGLGGRFDATNIISHPVLSVITSISLDHMEYLGDTVEQIAREKAGILKPGCPVVVATQHEAVRQVVFQAAQEKGCPFYYARQEECRFVEETEAGFLMEIKNEYLAYQRLSLSLRGRYQMQNAATALLALYALHREHGMDFEETVIRHALAHTRWPGRMEVVRQEPLVILDGAHNLDGIQALSQSLRQSYGGRPLTLLVGILGDKEYERMLDTVAPLAQQMVLTEPQSERKWQLETLGKVTAKYPIRVYFEKDIPKAYALAQLITPKDGVLCCAGSLYLIGALESLEEESGR